ncbi:MAG TPA: glutaminyl-peptide cyclotransferase [Candidatus Kapabacteria bacterium]|nr:glutaminyl-peptide cyclotransferase [Candidatus Kapabacteria bacterium]
MKSKFLYIVIGILLLFSCESQTHLAESNKENKKDIDVVQQKMYNVSIVRKFPHDSLAFTQGLDVYNGFIYESTGQLGQSSIRKVDWNTGEVLKKKSIPFKYFGEGLTIFNNEIYYFTWQDKIGWTFDIETFNQKTPFCYDSEGWGLTSNDKSLIMTDGTNLIRYKDKDNFNTLAIKEVLYQGQPLKFLNEIEYVDGDIYANIWGKDQIAVIDEKTGAVKTLIDLSFLRNELEGSRLAEVLNGIAYNSETKTFIVTGKNWPFYFELKID